MTQNKLLLEPQEVNKARLFNLELRVKDQEESSSRIELTQKELLKKLIFALEQHIMEKQENQKQMPRLLSHQKTRESKREERTSKMVSEVRETGLGLLPMSGMEEGFQKQQSSPYKMKDLVFIKRLFNLKSKLQEEDTASVFSGEGPLRSNLNTTLTSQGKRNTRLNSTIDHVID